MANMADDRSGEIACLERGLAILRMLDKEGRLKPVDRKWIAQTEERLAEAKDSAG